MSTFWQALQSCRVTGLLTCESMQAKLSPKYLKTMKSKARKTGLTIVWACLGLSLKWRSIKNLVCAQMLALFEWSSVSEWIPTKMLVASWKTFTSVKNQTLLKRFRSRKGSKSQSWFSTASLQKKRKNYSALRSCLATCKQGQTNCF